MTYNFSEQLSKDSETYGMNRNSDDSFNIEDGNQNVCRIISPAIAYTYHFMSKPNKSPVCYGYNKGCPVRERNEVGNVTTQHAKASLRYVLKVVDRKDGRVKTAFFPWSVVNAVAELQKNPDYTFSELPMPYDIRITCDRNAKDSKMMYLTTATLNREAVTAEQKEALDSQIIKGSSEMIVERMKQKQYDEDERSGRRLNEEQIRAETAKFLQDAIENDKQEHPVEYSKPIEYPADEINPADIPF